MSAEVLLFYVVGALLLLSAGAMIRSNDPVHAALWMVGNFLLTAVLYLVLQAPFIAAVQVIVYAGAIMVLFLFVVMLLGAQPMTRSEPIAGHRATAVFGLVALVALLSVAVARAPAAGRMPPPLTGDFGSPEAIGQALFTDWVLPFEWVSLMLLVALIGAVMIARFGSQSEDPEETSG